MSERFDPKRARRDTLDALLDRIDHEVNLDKVTKRKESWRPYRACPIKLSLTEPGGTTRVMSGISRNLSSGGISIICNGYLHAGSDCVVTLTTIDNAWQTVEGTVRRCEFVGGSVHEVGIEFRQPIDTARFVRVKVIARILIVEDDKTISRMTSFILNKAEAHTVTVETGEEAIKAAANARFDLILMDMLLPGMDGFEATQTLRARGITVPIVAFTALKDPDEHQRCVDAGCTDLLAKPVQRQELLECVLSNLTVTPLRSSLADDAEMEDMIHVFVDTLSSTLAAVRNCHKNNDLNGLLAGTRNLNAAAGMYGFEPIALAARELEILLEPRGGQAVTEATKTAVRTDGSLDPAEMNRAIEDKVEALLFVAQRARAGTPA